MKERFIIGYFLAFFSIILISFNGCKKAEISTDSDEIILEIREWFDYLCSPELGGRYSGSDGIKKAESYICDIIGSNGSLIRDTFDTPKCEMTNIYYHIEGESDSLIVIGAHYDAYGYVNQTVLPGADDNLSGVAVVLRCIELFQSGSLQPKYSYDLCFWDGEEIGRYGSKHYLDAYNEKQIKLYINVDTCGSVDEYKLGIHYSVEYPALQSVFTPLANTLDAELWPYMMEGTTTDCEQFETESIPFVTLSCTQNPSYLHSKRDNVSNISFTRIEEISSSLYDCISRGLLF